MSLFVGNISRLVEQKDIEREFKVYGDCTVDFRVKNNDRVNRYKNYISMHLYNI